MGIPIFSTKGDFTNEAVFIENETYICLNHKDVALSTEIIFATITDSKKLKQIGENGKKLYENNFGWAQYVNNLKFIMQKIENE
jgi:hypothetical protein